MNTKVAVYKKSNGQRRFDILISAANAARFNGLVGIRRLSAETIVVFPDPKGCRLTEGSNDHGWFRASFSSNAFGEAFEDLPEFGREAVAEEMWEDGELLLDLPKARRPVRNRVVTPKPVRLSFQQCYAEELKAARERAHERFLAQFPVNERSAILEYAEAIKETDS